MSDPQAESRPDRSKAIAVAAGLALLKAEGRAAAAAFMEDAGVPLPVIARVLNEPDRRRVPVTDGPVSDLPGTDLPVPDDLTCTGSRGK